MYHRLACVALLLFSIGFRVDCLQLSNCNKTDVPLIPDAELITSLSLHNCSFPRLENAFFVRFGHLLKLEVQNSGLTDMDDFSLNGLVKLQTFSLSHNNLSTLRSWSSEPLAALTALDLSYNRMAKLRENSFSLFPQLQQINLGSNQISQISEDSFHGLTHLKHLILSGNRLQHVDSTFFQGLHRLSSLALQHNLIESIDMDSFESNTHLRSLRLDGNLLVSLQFLSQRGLARLVHLNLSKNQVQKLEDQGFSKNFELQALDLSHNNLTELQKETFSGLDSLERLNISHNNVDLVDAESLQFLSSLIQIDVSHNRLTTLPERIFQANSQLEDVIMSHNKVKALSPLIFKHQNHLRYIHLAGNILEKAEFLESLSTSLNRLSLYVDLSSNRLQSVSMKDLLHFRYINLADNNWSCAWLVGNLVRKLPPSINFSRPWTVLNNWSEKLTNIQGVDCTEGNTNRSIILLNVGEVLHNENQNCSSGLSFDGANPSPPPLTWPKIPTDRFDSRSVIIWMLVAIAIAFAGLRWLRRFVDRNENRTGEKLKALNNMVG
ncbi:hypothetical protein KR026_003147 [Drosophila bipectinata]|nr:hypothetical protein KR026_003147 [Drosophila bipectinata]